MRQSLLWGCGVIDKSWRWRVGTGTKITIYGNRWLSTSSSFKVRSPIGLPPESKLQDTLLDSEKWNIVKIRGVLLPFEDDMIIATPRPLHRHEDSLIWHFDDQGLYSVKSRYRIAMEITSESSTSSSTPPSDLWPNLWKVKVPPKIRIFLWRACKNLIPTREI